MESLFGEDFNIDIEKAKATTKKLAKKLSTEEKEVDTDKLLKSKKLSLEERLAIINEKVIKTLGSQRSNTRVIRSLNDFSAYIDKAIEKGRIDIDTETNNSTDPVTCKLMGLCLYTPGEKQVYIPVNHIDRFTGELLPRQLTCEEIKTQLQRIVNAKTYIVMHNGKFDYEVLKCTCHIKVIPNWDTLVGLRLIDENKFSDKATSLKYVYTTEIDPRQSKYDIESLFENVPYAVVDPEIFALYAATDSMMTDKVYLWELETFFNKPENSKVLWLMENIEMPIVPVTAEIELKGVFIDQDLGAKLKEKYKSDLANLDNEINSILKGADTLITNWRLLPEANEKTKQYVPAKTKMSQEKIDETYTETDENGKKFKYGKPKTEQLPEEINLGSSTQMGILLYDILKCPVVNKKSPRATGEDELKEIIDRIKIAEKPSEAQLMAKNLCDKILERRGLTKLITTYIDVIPDLAKHWPDGRIRYRLNSTGTDTGRFASGGKFKFLDEEGNPVILNSINSQNIPSHNPEIRLLFKAAPGCRIVGSDYSGQELRLAAYLSQDEKLLDAYAKDQDAYAIIASAIYGCSYEDCLEFYPEGTEIEVDGQKIITGKKTHVNKEGKERRAKGKTAVLAGNYGMSGAGAGALMNKTAKEGQELLDNYFKMFPGLKSAIDNSKKKLRELGYVEDLVGRRRRLPDIFLKPYEITSLNKDSANFNPILGCADRDVKTPEVMEWEHKVFQELSKGRELVGKLYEKFVNEAKKDHVLIQANTSRIAQAERQCFNATIQGSAGTLTKKAMIDIANDPQLQAWHADLIITVHDEVLVECPEEYASLVEKRLPEIMINAALELGITAPKMKCDPYNVSRWYADSAAVAIRDEFKKLELGDKKKGLDPLSREEAFEKVYENHPELTHQVINNTIINGTDLDF